jgi:hypothetical protein
VWVIMNKLNCSRFNRNRYLVAAIILFLFNVTFTFALTARDLDVPPREDQVRYSPADGEISGTNPPAFIWLPADGVDSYIVQYSRDPSFPTGQTVTVRDIDMTIHVPTETVEPGTWHWRYGYNDGERDRFSRTRSFEIPGWAVEFPLVTADELIARIPMQRPRLFFSPEQVEDIRNDAEGRFAYLEVASVVEEAEKILAMEEPLFQEPEDWKIRRETGRWTPEERQDYDNAWQSMRRYTQRMVTSALAYLYTGDERYAGEARRRLMHFMTWDPEGSSTSVLPTPTELGMDIAKNAPAVFDWIYDTLSDEERQKCIEVLTARMEQINRDVHRVRPMESRPYSSHPGRMVGFVIEGGIVLAHEAPEAREWLDYTLKLLWSTYPAWGGDEGGWHEGVSYWRGYMNNILRVVAELDRYDVPLKDKPFFRNTGYFGLYAGYPGRPTRAFGDGQISSIGRGQGELMYNFSSLYQNPYFRWHADISGVDKPAERGVLLFHDPYLQARSPAELPSHGFFMMSELLPCTATWPIRRTT